jgi:hypothetical protein
MSGKPTDVPKGGCTAGKIALGAFVFVACAGGAVGGILGSGMLDDSSSSSSSSSGLACPVGTWSSNFGGYFIITETEWYSVSQWGSSMTTLTQCGDGMAIGQTPAYSSYNAGDWNKIEFHSVGSGDVAYCSSIYDAPTEAAALESDTSEIYDAADEAAGCNGFSFTILSPYELPITGSFTDDWGAAITITPTSFVSEASWGTSTYEIIGYGSDFMIAQNDANSYNPGMWTLFKYDVKDDGTFSFCMIVYDGASPEAALITDISATYDVDDAAAGCNGFSHSIATPN